MNVIDVFFILIKYFKDWLICCIVNEVVYGEIGENEIDFVFMLFLMLGDEVILFFCEVVIKVSYLYKILYII